ncbi:hypothetical protein B0H11DRAFT_1723784 [Mycena galericulata]|nr:hypothetical protein B0H11DRAFT_1723784 [Mycena galericulata]
MDSSPAAKNPCLVCDRVTSLWCSRCRSAWYCSTEHSRSDWPRHRKQCRRSGGLGYSMIATLPPESISVSGILFVASEDQPRITTIECQPPQPPSQGMCPVPCLQSYFDAPPASIVLTEGLNNEPLHFPLHIFYSDIALAEASPINRAIYHLTLRTPKPWYGNVVVLKFNGARCQGYSEADANDLPVLSAFFRSQ